MEHLTPMPAEERTWRWPTYAALWVAISVQPASYSFGGSLIALGLSAAESLIVTGLGMSFIAVAIIANSVPGAALGVPFPVYARASFGIAGAKMAALSRGIVGVMWLSFQLWLSADGLVQGLARLVPAAGSWTPIWDPYLNGSQLISLILTAAATCSCILAGIKHFDKLIFVAMPFGIAVFTVVLVWAVSPSLSGVSLQEELQLLSESTQPGKRVRFAWVVGVNAIVSMWSTVMMNAADLSRMAPRQRDQALGQLIGIPVPMTITVGIGILSSAALQLKTGEESWMMADLFAFWPSWVGALGGVMIFLLTLTVNIAANIIPPANDFMSLYPDGVTWRACAYGAVVAGVLICPFFLFHSATGFAVKFLGGYGMVTGALYGVMVSDYYIVRRCQLSIEDLYAGLGQQGAFEYFRGHNWRACLATVLGVLLPLPAWIAGFFDASDALPATFVFFGGASWFIAAGTSSVTYVLACSLSPPPQSFGGKAGSKSSGKADSEITTETNSQTESDTFHSVVV